MSNVYTVIAVLDTHNVKAVCETLVASAIFTLSAYGRTSHSGNLTLIGAIREDTNSNFSLANLWAYECVHKSV